MSKSNWILLTLLAACVSLDSGSSRADPSGVSGAKSAFFMREPNRDHPLLRRADATGTCGHFCLTKVGMTWECPNNTRPHYSDDGGCWCVFDATC